MMTKRYQTYLAYFCLALLLFSGFGVYEVCHCVLPHSQAHAKASCCSDHDAKEEEAPHSDAKKCLDVFCGAPEYSQAASQDSSHVSQKSLFLQFSYQEFFGRFPSCSSQVKIHLDFGLPPAHSGKHTRILQQSWLI